MKTKVIIILVMVTLCSSIGFARTYSEANRTMIRHLQDDVVALFEKVNLLEQASQAGQTETVINELSRLQQAVGQLSADYADQQGKINKFIQQISRRVSSLENPQPVPNFNKYFCLLLEPAQKFAFLGIGDNLEQAQAKAKDACIVDFSRTGKSSASCELVTAKLKCDNWQDFAGVKQVSCTMSTRSDRSRQIFSARGRTKIEAEGYMYASCQNKAENSGLSCSASSINCSLGF